MCVVDVVSEEQTDMLIEISFILLLQKKKQIKYANRKLEAKNNWHFSLFFFLAECLKSLILKIAAVYFPLATLIILVT